MAFRQKAVVALCVVLNGLDGFDVLSISFAAPGIARDWGIDRTQLGIVLSMELVGMAIGSIFLGQVADRVGRRITTLVCLAIMALGMLMAALSTNSLELGAVRLATGLGIGGLLASVSAIAAGASNERTKTMSVALMATGYPLGAVVGGAISSRLLVGGDWRLVFLLGASLTALLLPVAHFALPESFDSLLRRHTGEALRQKINRSLAMLGRAPLASLGILDIPEKARLGALVNGPLGKVTALLLATYFLHMLSFYFMLKWIPKVVADLGLQPAQAAGVLVWANVGGVIGSFLLSLLTARISLRILVTISLAMSAAFLVAFGSAPAEMRFLAWAAGLAGFSANAVIVGLYALIATSYPPHMRGSGTGLVLGLGRGGAALGPVLGGVLFASGFDRGGVTLLMAGGSACAVVTATLLFRFNQRPTSAA